MSSIIIESPIISDEIELRKPCEEVSNEEGQDIAQKLINVLKNEPTGAALAAPQIGIFKKVFVEVAQIGWNIYINPIITELSNPGIFKNEGCLSFKGQWLDTIRYNSLRIRTTNGVDKMVNGFSAVVAQHEVGHLNSDLMFDHRVPNQYDLCFCGSQKKFKFCCSSKLNIF